MTRLRTAVNLSGHDDLFQALGELHQGLAPDESRKADAKLVLLLANHIGDPEVVAEAIDAVRSTLPGAGSSDGTKED